ncbi:hypothetical protein TNIN_444201 [Trichonephila inaurata madagascariensis]|uniref:Uncharacterized protein n=1 Tax=Trichonephila inaurata madagascariensis TaxID=2747483 RepID=A0A8X7C936_9ARAC|nr:hypothetical protein TNIN_444201 [Trichonephila inaurata madagascariensis]
MSCSRRAIYHKFTGISRTCHRILFIRSAELLALDGRYYPLENSTSKARRRAYGDIGPLRIHLILWNSLTAAKLTSDSCGRTILPKVLFLNVGTMCLQRNNYNSCRITFLLPKELC